MAKTVKLTVNGKRHTVTSAPDTPLLYVLRNELDLQGPRFGCGLSQCGACTVHVDGEAVRSCIVPVSAVAGKKVTTLEGLGDGEEPAPGPRGVHRRAGRPVRLLHQRHGDAVDPVPEAEPAPDRGADQEGPQRQHLPLRDALPHRQGSQARRAGDGVQGA